MTDDDVELLATAIESAGEKTVEHLSRQPWTTGLETGLAIFTENLADEVRKIRNRR